MINIDIHNKDVHHKTNTLSAILKADSFFYGIFNQHELVYAKTYVGVDYSNPKQLIEDAILSQNFASISISVGENPVLHLREKDDNLLRFYPAFENKSIFVENITGQDTYTYFAISNNQADLLNQLFKHRGYSLHHLSTSLAHQSFPSSENIIAHIEDKKLHILSCLNGKFAFYNQFDCTCKEDFLYYTLLVYHQLGLDPNVYPLTLSGAVDKISETYQILYGYIRNIQTASPALLRVRAEHPKHYYYNLYATAQCG